MPATWSVFHRNSTMASLVVRLQSDMRLKHAFSVSAASTYQSGPSGPAAMGFGLPSTAIALHAPRRGLPSPNVVEFEPTSFGCSDGFASSQPRLYGYFRYVRRGVWAQVEQRFSAGRRPGTGKRKPLRSTRQSTPARSNATSQI